jgi:hypothetical protein
MHTKYWSKNLNVINIGIDERIILKCILKIAYEDVNWILMA